MNKLLGMSPSIVIIIISDENIAEMNYHLPAGFYQETRICIWYLSTHEFVPMEERDQVNSQ